MNRFKTGYTPTAKLLHWLVVLLLIVQYVIAWNMPHIGRNTIPDGIINLHFSLGVLILFAIVLRIFWKWLMPEPAPLAGMPPWQVATSRIVHYALYLLLLAMPILGWLNASFRGFEVSAFGLFTLPKLIPAHASEFAWTGDTHIFISYYVLLPMAGLHIAAALYHEFIRRDGVLRRMLPGSSS